MANIKELKAILDEAEIKYPAKANLADLEALVTDFAGSDDDAEVEVKEEKEVEVKEEKKIKLTTDQATMKKNLEKQEKVEIFIPAAKNTSEEIVVTLNGYRIGIPKGVRIQVPKQIADIYFASIQATENAGKEKELDGENPELNW